MITQQLDDKYINGKEIMKLLNIKNRYFFDLKSRDDFPEPFVLSRKCVRYKYSEVIEWIETFRNSKNKEI